MWPKWARMSLRATFWVYSCRYRREKITIETFPPRKFCVAFMEPWKVWNVAEKPCCCARCRVDRNGEADHIFNIFSKYICEVKESACDFSWTEGLYCDFWTSPSSDPAACISRVSALRCLLVALDLNSFNCQHKYIQHRVYEWRRYQYLRIEK